MDSWDVDKIAVMDFGSQYTHLIARRVRELNVYSEVVPHDIPLGELSSLRPKGIILSGSPFSVYDEGSPKSNPGILRMGIPVLGICYGLQLIAYLLGGSVARALRQEYGKAELAILDKGDLFAGLPSSTTVWMSHGDYIEKLPEGSEVLARTESCPTAAVRFKGTSIFGVQFHPEVRHTQHGKDIIQNFVFGICGCRESWSMSEFARRAVEEIRGLVGGDRVLCAVSGGIDSLTTAILVSKAVGERLKAVFVNHGLLRKGEAEEVVRLLRDRFNLDLISVDASRRFLERLKGVSDAEEKRRAIGEEFIKVFTEVGKGLGEFKWLAQGTLYPDVIESAKAGGPASRIKSHHNVAALPGWMSFRLLEPLRFLYKDEVRKLAKELGIPHHIASRHPFPGPGLAVRILGEVTEEKLRICREASSIVEEELKAAGLYEGLWQAFAIVGDDRAVGIKGDERRLGYIVTVRIVESEDAMTADWARVPYDVLERISSRITNEIPEVTWVAYAISSKPPSTIEPC